MTTPSPCTESYDTRFDQLVLFNAELELLADGFRWVEGPVWFGDHNCLLFNDIPNNRTMRWSPEHGVSVFREPSDYANGQTRDRQGRLITCHHASRCLTRLEADGTPTIDLAEHIRFTREVSEASLFTGTVAAAPDAEQRAAIRRVQTGLAELAYTPGEINGELTRETRDAIMAFQRDHKMPETGEVSDELIAELGKVSGQSETATQ